MFMCEVQSLSWPSEVKLFICEHLTLLALKCFKLQFGIQYTSNKTHTEKKSWKMTISASVLIIINNHIEAFITTFKSHSKINKFY